VKKDVKSKVAAKRNGCDGRLKPKILITTIQVICVAFFTFHYDFAPNSTELSFLALAYHHSHFLAATLDFTFFHNCILGGCALYYSWAVLD